MRRFAPALLTFAAVSTLTAGCDSDSGAGPDPDIPAAIAVVSGDGQSALAGAGLGAPLVVRVTNADGDPLEGAPVVFRVVSGGGAVNPTGALTDADGRAQTAWTLGTAGNQVAQAQSGTRVASFTATLSGQPGPAAVVASPDSVVLDALGDTARFRAEARTAAGAVIPGAPLTWTALDPGVASVDGAGLVTSQGAGRGRIVVASGGRADTVVARVAPVTASVRIVPELHAFAAVNDTFRYAAQALDRRGNVIPGSVFAWTSLDPSAAGVDGGGLATARGAGDARIVAASGGRADTALARVTLTVSSLVVLPPVDSIFAVNDTVRLRAEVRGPGGGVIPDPGVIWVSLDPSVATVGGTSGLVTGLAFGTARIRASYGETLADTARVLVLPGGTVDLRPDSVALGSSLLLRVTLRDRFGNVVPSRALQWSSSDPAVVAVDSVGRVEGVSLGTAQVTARSASGHADTAAVTVVPVFGARAVAIGTVHGCALSAAGDAYCWGNNARRQLGRLPLTTGPLGPGAVTGAPPFVQIEVGYSHSCGRTAAGAVYCWGEGALGDGTAAHTAPAPVAGGLAFATISAEDAQTCGITVSGAAYCWGDNTYGQLGSGDSADALVPRAVAGGLTFDSLSVGLRHACALDTAGLAWCWGSDGGGALGNGAAGSTAAPSPVAGGRTYRSISAGDGMTCAIGTDGVTYCWGALAGSTVPVPIPSGLAFTQVSASTGGGRLGSTFTCGLTPAGQIRCWGFTDESSLGDGTTNGANAATPVLVAGGHTWRSVSAGTLSVCGITTGGELFCWGNNRYGQLGDGTTAIALVPRPMPQP